LNFGATDGYSELNGSKKYQIKKASQNGNGGDSAGQDHRQQQGELFAGKNEERWALRHSDQRKSSGEGYKRKKTNEPIKW